MFPVEDVFQDLTRNLEKKLFPRIVSKTVSNISCFFLDTTFVMIYIYIHIYIYRKKRQKRRKLKGREKKTG